MGRGTRRIVVGALLAALVVGALLAVAPVPAAHAAPDLDPFSGLGSWVDVFD